MLAGKVVLPSRDAMLAEIASHRDAAVRTLLCVRCCRLSGASLQANIIFESCRAGAIFGRMIHFHDRLLKDMGIGHHRKKNPLKEYFAPYGPGDFNI